jgi:putative Mg2+ transporter-C (MgtC) family protein
MDLIDGVVRMLIVAGLAGLIGLEREMQRKPAGMRTHMMIGIGSALFAYVGVAGFEGSGGTDLSRIAAQVAAGIGFIGAGVIFREGLAVKGLTTAGGLWVVAAVGVAAGVGQIAIAVAVTIVSLIILLGLPPLEKALASAFSVNSGRVRVVADSAVDLNGLVSLVTTVDGTVDVVDVIRGEGSITVDLDTEAGRAPSVVGVLSTVDHVRSADIVRRSSK